MAKISYVPFDPVFYQIFIACGIDLEPTSYGNNQGWDPTAFENAVNDAIDFIYDDGVVTDEEDAWLESLYGGYTLFYWSTEKLVDS